jgi:predicted glycoside hydrolase/deacetylase ChbG (UPF0249 family)
MKLIVNADDFGISKAVTLGIIEAHKEGVITSTTMMCNMPNAEYGAQLAKACPELGVGIHFVLTAGFPLAAGVDSLVDEIGRFHGQYKIEDFATIEDIRKEFRCQMDKFLSFGIKPTHINTHHHVHRVGKIFEVVKEFALEYDIPVRAINEICKEKFSGIRTTAKYSEEFYGDNGDREITIQAFINIIEKNKKFESLEIMCHPGYLDKELVGKSSYAIPRLRELTTLTSQEVKNYIKEKNIELINYKYL